MPGSYSTTESWGRQVRTRPSPHTPQTPPLPTPAHPTLASLKLRSRASLLAPASCTLAMDMTLPKKEKEATSSSFSRCSRWALPSAARKWTGVWGPRPVPTPKVHAGQPPCAHSPVLLSFLVGAWRREEEGKNCEGPTLPRTRPVATSPQRGAGDQALLEMAGPPDCRKRSQLS